MKVIGKQINNMDEDVLSTEMAATSTLVNGSMGRKRVLAKKLTQTEPSMMDNGRTECDMDKVSSS